jgi:hypothetical protein
MVCSVLLRRDLLYTLHACYAIGKRDHLVYTVTSILSTSARTGYTGLCTGIRLRVGLFYCVQCLLYLR